MSRQLISRSPDLTLLREEGYEIEVRSEHLLLKNVPYVDSKRAVRYGTLVVPLGDISGDATRPPSDHTAFFRGEHPCTSDGTRIKGIIHSSETKTLARGVVVDHMFSAIPQINGGKYRDYHHKMLTYVSHISNPAREIDSSVTAQTGVLAEPGDEDSPFNYLDSASTRAGISAITAKLEKHKVAIIGAGGTGSYVLDLVAKTPVSEIHLYDADDFLNHNAFRSPGAPSLDELKARPSKVARFRDLYSKMHRGISAHETFIEETNVEELRSMDFVFLCLDRGGDKRVLIERLNSWGTAYVDVGMGVNVVDGALRGALRVTTSTSQKRDHVEKRIPLSNGEAENDYSRNIQIADLNALNAALAVIKWKKLCGFYQDLEREHCCAYTINGNALANEDQA